MSDNRKQRGHKTCKSDKEFANCKPKHAKPKKALLECGQGTGDRTFNSPNDGPFQLAYVTVDTTCLTKPEVLIKFSSLVNVERLDSGATVRLKYELSKVCEGGEIISLGIWMFEKVNIPSSEFENNAEESFNFIFCECIGCSRCCEYFVTVTPVEIINARATVSNGRMAAISQALTGTLEEEDKISDSKYAYNRYKQRHPKPKDVILECGRGTGNVVFSTEDEPSARVANVTIEALTSYKSEVVIEYSSIINYAALTKTQPVVELRFELFMSCDNGDPVSKGVWTFDVDFIDQQFISSKAFGFIFCETVTCLGCCEYFVVVTPTMIPTGWQFGDNTMVSDSRLVALVQSNTASDRKKSYNDYEESNLEVKGLLLECGQGTGSAIFTESSDSGFQLAQVTIDTSCSPNPKVNVEFSSIVTVDADSNQIEVILRYELIRVCDDGQSESRGIWILRRSSLGDISDRFTESFDFTFCEPVGCKSGCCTYIVKVIPIEIVNAQVTVSNGRIAALAQDGC